ncbi:Threonine/homoserine/homoserine lactone efflux protein [Salegentibacter echinorum]|uniref:Threonine/homoserine/homoserine lactone efflux protein n=1 Tax=Salegentibacter echinorum TaxID=1073325 RepID=A0A1M5HN98_SALEC|nr:LysE family transporter [Salegentibacter echinorum]SHG17439.1 Threonine/homoserine/homoserine lactone efflux protein [Salegentibacter echinorum]
MEETKLFLITFFAALIGVVPPGLVNMTVAKTCVEKGKKNGLYVAIGATIVVIVQATIAVLLAKYIFRNEFVQNILLRTALVIFIILGVYFFIQAKNRKGLQHHSQKTNSNSIFKGMLIAALNVFPIPYFVAVAGALNIGTGMNYHWIRVIVFVLAASLGTFTTLYFYVISFIRIEKQAEAIAKYSNYFMAILMLVLIIVTLLRIYYT